MNHINQKIKEAILECKPEIFGKIGGIEASHLYQFLMTGLPQLVRGNTLFVNAGIFCEEDFFVSVYSPGQDYTRPPSLQLDL